MAQSYRDLVVWQMAMEVVDQIYGVADTLPPDERFALRSQMIRAAISAPANIAEGNRRGAKRDYANFIAIARGSLAELETYVLISIRRGYIPTDHGDRVMDAVDHLGRLLTNLRKSLTR